MTHFKKYSTELNAIIKLIDEKKLLGKEEILPVFRVHIQSVASIGRFSKEEWDVGWRKSVYELGKRFNKLDPTEFLRVLNEEKLLLDKDKQEVLDFYRSEIEFNSLPPETNEIGIKLLIEKYPYNPEFYHSLGNIYFQKQRYEEAIRQFNFALEKDERNPTFEETLFNSYYEYFELLIDNSSYEKGLELSNNLVLNKTFWQHAFYHNYILSIKERFKDYININNKIKEAEVSIKEIVLTETKKGQDRLIEILGFFTAIIAFIFSTVSIGKNFSFNEALLFNITLGLILLLFVITINLFFSSKTLKLRDLRLLLFMIIAIAILLIVSKFGMKIWME